MKYIHMDKVYFLVVCLILTFGIQAQSGKIYGPDESAADIIMLKEKGVLVVRLEGEKKKLEALEGIRSEASNVQRVALEEQIEEVRAERDSFNLNLIRAFHENFDFCPVFFIYDHSAREFLAGTREGIFLNETGYPDPGIQWTNKPFLGLRSGEAINGPEGLIITDRFFRDLPDPFPGFVQRNSIGSLFNWILSRDIYYRKNADRMVDRLDRSLTRFYLKVLSDKTME